eukprot:6184942-Pleurochrysis_carterae.AAC.3
MEESDDGLSESAAVLFKPRAFNRRIAKPGRAGRLSGGDGCNGSDGCNGGDGCKVGDSWSGSGARSGEWPLRVGTDELPAEST